MGKSLAPVLSSPFACSKKYTVCLMVCRACYHLQVVLCLLTKSVCQPKVQGTKVCIERLIHLRHHKRFKNLSCESLLLPSHDSHRKRCKYCRAPHQLTVYAVRYGARCNTGPVQTISSSQSSHVQSTWHDLERLHQPETTVKSMPSGFVNPRRVQDGNAITCDNWSAWVASYLSGLCGCCMASATPCAAGQRPQWGRCCPRLPRLRVRQRSSGSFHTRTQVCNGHAMLQLHSQGRLP